MIDFSTDYGKHVAERLQKDWIIWLTTVDSEGTPQPRPVWFVWDNGSFVLYSKPGTFKLKHIERNPRVSLNLDGDGEGGDIVVFTGTARIDETAPTVDRHEAYMAKYLPLITDRMKSDPARFAKAYTIAIRITPDEMRGF